jgi:hypothetical protein
MLKLKLRTLGIIVSASASLLWMYLLSPFLDKGEEYALVFGCLLKLGNGCEGLWLVGLHQINLILGVLFYGGLFAIWFGDRTFSIDLGSRNNDQSSPEKNVDSLASPESSFTAIWSQPRSARQKRPPIFKEPLQEHIGSFIHQVRPQLNNGGLALGIVSLVVGVLSFFIPFTWVFAILFGIILGAVGFVSGRRAGYAPGWGMSLAGIIVSTISVYASPTFWLTFWSLTAALSQPFHGAPQLAAAPAQQPGYITGSPSLPLAQPSAQRSTLAATVSIASAAQAPVASAPITPLNRVPADIIAGAPSSPLAQTSTQANTTPATVSIVPSAQAPVASAPVGPVNSALVLAADPISSISAANNFTTATKDNPAIPSTPTTPSGPASDAHASSSSAPVGPTDIYGISLTPLPVTTQADKAQMPAMPQVAPYSAPKSLWASKAVTLRAMPNESAAEVGHLKAGDQVTALGKVQGESWVQIQRSSGPAYAYEPALSASKPSASTVPSDASQGTTSASLPSDAKSNIRSISGQPSVLDTANLVVQNQIVSLFGIEGLGAPYDNEIGNYIRAQGDTVQCTPQGAGKYICLLPSGIDVARAALTNGAARTTSEAPSDYVHDQEDAQQHHLGVWASSQLGQRF